MSQVLSGIWTTADKPTCIWEGLPEVCEPEANEWPDLLTDRLTITERTGWNAIQTERAFHQQAVVCEQLTLDFDLERFFESLASQWREDTEHMSNLNKACTHFGYQQIIGMGRVAPGQVVPLILRELELRPDHWFWALHEITNEDPAQPDDDFDGAVDAWLAWGRRKGYLR